MTDPQNDTPYSWRRSLMTIYVAAATLYAGLGTLIWWLV